MMDMAITENSFWRPVKNTAALSLAIPAAILP